MIISSDPPFMYNIDNDDVTAIPTIVTPENF